MFLKPGRAKILTNPSEMENQAKIQHKLVMLSALHFIYYICINNQLTSLDSNF